MPGETERRPWSAELAATLAVALYSVAIAAGFARVFSGWDFMDDLLVVVIAGHGIGLVLRWLRVPAWAAIPLSAATLVVAIALRFYPSTCSWGLPTSETWSVFRFELDDVRDQFPSAVAPVVYGAGWDVLAAIGLAIAVLLADAFAFRAYARAETLVPGGVLFVFVGALGSDRLRVALTVAVVACGVVTTVVLRSYHSTDGTRTSIATRLGRLAPATVAATLVIALGAGYLGPRLPGAEAAPIYDTRGGGGGTTEMVSPLVDIRSRLTNRSDVELFRVQADVESYWRTAALPQFDGTTWGMPAEETASDPLSEQPESGTVNRQRISITGLGGTFVPAAPQPAQASGRDDLRWIADSATLVTIDGDLERGDVIEVVSVAPELTPELLEAASSGGAGDPVLRQVPSDLPAVVATTARQVTAGAQSTYEAARLLQAWFQREFDYSLEVQRGHGNSAIERFLRERVGYCEQFAGTYAAMMRTLGYPARVAVGFTSGRLDDGEFSVLGRNAHAWPEVWFDGYGWVAFEPTPGRGAPNAEGYTGLPPQQDVPVDEPAPDESDAEPAPPTTRPDITPTPGIDLPDEFADPTGATSSPTTPSGRGLDWTPVLVLAGVAAVLAMPAVVRRVRSRRRAGDVDAQLARIWSDSVDSVRRAGVPVRRGDTPLETAAATARALPAVARPFSEIAGVITTATYGPDGSTGLDTVGDFGSSVVRSCQGWQRQISRTVDETSSLPERVWRYFTVWS